MKYKKLNQENMPEVIKDAMEIIEGIHPNLKPSVLLVAIMAKIMLMISFKRVKFSEIGNTRQVNGYMISLAPSGSGKDKSLKDLDELIFNLILAHIQDSYNSIYDEENKRINAEYASNPRQLEKEQKQLRRLTVQTNNATPEGIFSDALALSKQKVGSIFIKISELAYTLSGSEGKKFLKCIFSCYDGDFDSKSIKSANKVDNIKDIPISFLGLSDPSEITSNLNGSIRTMLEMGLARRAFLAFQPTCTITCINPQEYRNKLQVIYQKAAILSQRFFDIFEKIENESTYNFREDTLDEVIYPYKNELAEKVNNETDSILQKEILSRELKVLNIACLYACIAHPEDKQIYKTDALMARYTVEFLATDINCFLNYRPIKEDAYGRMFNILYENKGKHFKKTEFIHTYYKEIGVSRKKLRDEFVKFIAMVKEIANMHKCEVYEEYSSYRNTIHIWIDDKNDNDNQSKTLD